MASDLKTIIDAMQEELRVSDIPDYSAAHNGLQLTNGSGKVTKVAAAVDACLPVIRAACEAGCKLLLVHHGMFWNGTQMLTGSFYEKIKLAMDHDLAIYSVHLPLDVHPTLGNNVQLATECGLGEGQLISPWKGLAPGLSFEVELQRDAFVNSVKTALGGSAVHLCPGGPETIRRVAIITGGAGSEVAAVAKTGADTLLTGEGPHWSYTLAEELGVNLIYGGHYATETFGVKALASWLETTFGLPWEFIDHPSGL